jgi:uncharacterized protein (TIGR02444 family)
LFVTDAHSHFWDFSLRIYALPGIRDECLRLQDCHSTNINLLLFCAFCGARFGAKLSAEDLAEASARVSGWHIYVTNSLRQARRSIKRLQPNESVLNSNAIETLRQDVKQLELAAEQIEHLILQDWWHAKSSAASVLAPIDAISSNFALLLGPNLEAPILMNAALTDEKK